MLNYFYLGLYKLFGFLLWILPDVLIRALIKGLGWFAYMFSAKHRNIIHNNLDLAFKPPLDDKEKKEIGVHAFMNLIDTVFGIIRRDGMSKDEVLKNVSFEGEEIIAKYLKDGKRFILVTGHYGNWELLSQSIAIKFNLTLVGVGRKLDSDLMDKVLKENRERFNVEMVYKKGAMKGCIKAINQGKTVGILTDQSIRPNQSIDVDFFDIKTTHTPLASILSRKFGLDLVPAFISTEDYINYKVKVYEPIKVLKTDKQEEDLVALTQAQADITEQVIREDSKQWFWMHKRWKIYHNDIYLKGKK
jgi:KDO2-lipid IV(A) lauroyltransferase